MTARAGIHGGEQGEAGGNCTRASPNDGDATSSGAERLSVAPEFRQFVEEQHSAVGQADSARPRLRGTADHAGGAHAGMRTAKRSSAKRGRWLVGDE